MDEDLLRLFRRCDRWQAAAIFAPVFLCGWGAASLLMASRGSLWPALAVAALIAFSWFAQWRLTAARHAVLDYERQPVEKCKAER